MTDQPDFSADSNGMVTIIGGGVQASLDRHGTASPSADAELASEETT